MHWAPQMANCMLCKFNLIFFLFKYHWEKEMGEYGKDETSFLWRREMEEEMETAGFFFFQQALQAAP